MIKLQKELTPEQFEEQILKPLGQKVSDIETHLTNALEMHTLSSRQRTLAFLLWQTNEVMYKALICYYNENGQDYFEDR